MLTACYILSFYYFGLLLIFISGIFFTGKSSKLHPRGISVIIAARNEEKYLPHLLENLLEQNYPDELYEIIIINDRSTDNTSDIINYYERNYTQIRGFSINEEKSDLKAKKGALDCGIRNSSFELLAFTDADCLPSLNWLQEINNHFQKGVDFIAGYSPLIIDQWFLALLKNLERASIFAVNAGSFGWNWGFTCTARNMAYRKEIFLKAGGFEGIGHLRSGDDDLLLQKLMKFIRKLNFMFSQNSIVKSYDKQTAKEQFDLENRRASKWRYYPVVIKLMSMLVFFYFLSLTGTFLFSILGLINWVDFLILIGFKILIEFCLLLIFNLKVKKLHLLSVFPLAEIIYIPYFVFFALKGTFGKYSWKN